MLLIAYGLMSCSIPNLESPECTESRNVVREFYSFHFGNDMQPSLENLKLRERFLSPEFGGKLMVDVTSYPKTTIDYFTHTDDFPKAFRVGECRVIDTGKRTDFEILLFWKDNERSEQRSIHAEAVKENNKWLIDDVKP
ncbi:MAG TPA: DUF3828 domain-containing protein [Pyrinomonadaceae bacterium]|nr:DUF3828 domain-containing protein [Pyrinomonadaceae bacterium]